MASQYGRGRPEVTNSYLFECQHCSNKATLDIIERPGKYASSKCPACGLEIKYPNSFCLPSPIGTTLRPPKTIIPQPLEMTIPAPPPNDDTVSTPEPEPDKPLFDWREYLL